MSHMPCVFFFFFFNDTATTEIYTLSLHDALPISNLSQLRQRIAVLAKLEPLSAAETARYIERSEEHTSELQSLAYLVCRLLLEKKKKNKESTPLISDQSWHGYDMGHLYA